MYETLQIMGYLPYQLVSRIVFPSTVWHVIQEKNHAVRVTPLEVQCPLIFHQPVQSVYPDHAMIETIWTKFLISNECCPIKKKQLPIRYSKCQFSFVGFVSSSQKHSRMARPLATQGPRIIMPPLGGTGQKKTRVRMPFIAHLYPGAWL